MKILKKAELCTFPIKNKNFCHCFAVSTRWLYKKVGSLKKFFEIYTWDDTYFIYFDAKRNNHILRENEQA